MLLCLKMGQKFTEGFLFGSLAQNRNLNAGDGEIPFTTVKNGAGGGIKAGVFPAFTNYLVGITGRNVWVGT